ncbi:MAG: hypothetical protein Kow002_20800 [Anaerolineales bacterium]
MHGTSSKWLFLLVAVLVLATPFSARAQEPVALSSLQVSFWPEFDQPSMLVIYDFILSPDAELPAEVALRIPAEADLIAVAYEQGGGLLNASYNEPYQDGEWMVIPVLAETPSIYRIEYYAPITFDGSKRQFTYLWPGDHAVNQFMFELQIPPDTTELSSSPELTIERQTGGLQYKAWAAEGLAEGEQIPFTLTYTRTSNTLTRDIQPMQAEPVDENTSGRISLSNYLPYILGGVGIILIVAGGVYFWQSGKGKPRKRQRQRHRSQAVNSDEQTYCHQCGKRAQASDRFCRTCGTRLRR